MSARAGRFCGDATAAVSNQINKKCAKRRNKNLLISQYIQGSLELAEGVRIARRGDPPAVQIAGLIQLAQLFEGLPAMIIRGGILGIGRQNGFELLNGSVQVARPHVFHRQAITSKGIGGIVGHHPAQGI